MTKANMIKILTAMEDNARACANLFQETGNDRMYNNNKGQASAIATVIQMLERPQFAKELAEIYEIEL